MIAIFPLRTVTDKLDGGSGAEKYRDRSYVIAERLDSNEFKFNLFKVVVVRIKFTCRNRNSPRQPIAMCLIGVVKPEVIICARKSIRELYGITNFLR